MVDNTNINELIKLIKANPDLPVIPLVNGDVFFEEGYSFYYGNFGKASLGELAIFDDRIFDDREDFCEYYYDKHDEELCEEFGYNPRITEYAVKEGKYTKAELKKNSKAEKKLNKHINSLAVAYFFDAIIVKINNDF